MSLRRYECVFLLVQLRFHFLCGRYDLDPKEEFHRLVRHYFFHGALKPRFNKEKRAEAGIPRDSTWALTEKT